MEVHLKEIEHKKANKQTTQKLISITLLASSIRYNRQQYLPNYLVIKVKITSICPTQSKTALNSHAAIRDKLIHSANQILEANQPQREARDELIRSFCEIISIVYKEPEPKEGNKSLTNNIREISAEIINRYRQRKKPSTQEQTPESQTVRIEQSLKEQIKLLFDAVEAKWKLVSSALKETLDFSSNEELNQIVKALGLSARDNWKDYIDSWNSRINIDLHSYPIESYLIPILLQLSPEKQEIEPSIYLEDPNSKKIVLRHLETRIEGLEKLISQLKSNPSFLLTKYMLLIDAGLIFSDIDFELALIDQETLTVNAERALESLTLARAQVESLSNNFEG